MQMLSNPYAPPKEVILETCAEIFRASGERGVLNYLAETAAWDFNCPDLCSDWAVNFYGQFEYEIEGING